MEVLKTSNEKDWVVIENDRATIVDEQELFDNLARIESRLVEIPKPPTDEELLAWARTNFPVMNYDAEVAQLNKDRDRIWLLLAAIEGGKLK